jgi:hypothetical protein
MYNTFSLSYNANRHMLFYKRNIILGDAKCYIRLCFTCYFSLILLGKSVIMV